MKSFKINIKTSITVLLACLAFSANAQTVTHNNNLWLHYVGKAGLNKNWSFTLEGTLRRTEFGGRMQQWFIRPSLDRTLNKHFTASLGYSHYVTYSYGNPSMFFMNIPEDHIWLQLSSRHQLGKWTISNRLRDENRFVGIAERTKDSTTGLTTDRIAEYKYRNRVRYMLLLSRPVISRDGKTLVSLVLGDEAFLNIGSFSGKSLMNQNRVIAGFTWNMSKNKQLQLCYIHQNIWNFSNTILENNPSIRLSFYHNFNLYKNEQTK